MAIMCRFGWPPTLQLFFFFIKKRPASVPHPHSDCPRFPLLLATNTCLALATMEVVVCGCQSHGMGKYFAPPQPAPCSLSLNNVGNAGQKCHVMGSPQYLVTHSFGVQVDYGFWALKGEYWIVNAALCQTMFRCVWGWGIRRTWPPWPPLPSNDMPLTP